MPIDHPVLEERPVVLCPILKCEHTVAVLEVLMPVALVLAAIGVVEGALAVAEPIEPVTDVSVSEKLVVAI